MQGTDSNLLPGEKEALKCIANRIQNSLDGASLAVDKKDVVTSLLNVHNLIQEIIHDKKVEYLGHDIDITYFRPINFQEINLVGVKDDFMRMLSNLINNAIEACCYKSADIKIELYKSNDVVKLSINDNGRGIPSDILQVLRDGKPTTHGKQFGHGIGMQQIREVIAKLNGTLEIGSIVGRGSSFVIKFDSNK